MIVRGSHSRWHSAGATHQHTGWSRRSVRATWSAVGSTRARSHSAHARCRRSWSVRLAATLGRWSRSRFLLAFKLVQRLFRGQRHDRILAVKFLLRKSLHHVAHAILRAQRNHTETLGLSVGTVLEEFDLLEIINAHVTNHVRNVLIRRPPGQIPDVKLVPPGDVVHRPRPMMMVVPIPVRAIQPVHRRSSSGIVPAMVAGRRNHIVVQISTLATKFILQNKRN